MNNWYVLVNCLGTHCLFCKRLTSNLACLKLSCFVLVGTHTGSKVSFYPRNLRSFISFSRILFTVCGIWTLRTKAQPKTLMAVVHREAAGERWRSLFVFQSARNTLGEVLERATKVRWMILRASGVFVQAPFFVARQLMKSMVFEIGVVELYFTSSNFAHNALNLSLAPWMTPTFLNGLILF